MLDFRWRSQCVVRSIRVLMSVASVSSCDHFIIIIIFVFSCVSADQWVIYIDGLDLIPAIQLASKNLSYLLGSICASLS